MRVIAVAVALLAPAVAQAQPLAWERVTLPDQSASIDLPRDVFPVDRGASGAERHTFTTADARADVSLYSLPNQPQRTPAQFLDEEFSLPQSSAIYRRVTGNMLAVSGYRNDQIYYVRCNFARTRLQCVALNYPGDEKRRWDAIVTRISNSLSRGS
jgi:hypothetical protein